jgi:hypothetical protein
MTNVVNYFNVTITPFFRQIPNLPNSTSYVLFACEFSQVEVCPKQVEIVKSSYNSPFHKFLD